MNDHTGDFYTDLQEQLAAPEGGAVKKERLAALDTARLRLKRRLTDTLSRALHERCGRAIEAFSTASEVLDGIACEDEIGDQPSLFQPRSKTLRSSKS